MPLAPFNISSGKVAPTTQREFDALARGPIGGGMSSGPSDKSVSNAKRGVGPEGVLASGLDQVMAAGIQAGEEGDYEAAALAHDFISSQVEDEGVKKTMASALSYDGEKGRDPAKDLLRTQAEKFYSSEWRLRMSRLASPLTNPRASEFELSKASESLRAAGKKDPVAFVSELTEKWNKGLGEAAIGNAKLANGLRSEITKSLIENPNMLDPLLKVRVTPETPPAIQEAVIQAKKFKSGEYLSEKADQFDENTNKNSTVFQETQKRAVGLDNDAAKIRVAAERGDALAQDTKTLTDTGAKANGLKQGSRGDIDAPVDTLAFVNATTKPAQALAEKLNSIEKDPSRKSAALNAVGSNLAGVRSEHAIQVLDNLTKNAETISVVPASEAFRASNKEFIASFTKPGPDGKTSLVDDISLGQLQDVPVKAFNLIAGQLNGDTSMNPETRGQYMKTKMRDAVARINTARGMFGNDYINKEGVLESLVESPESEYNAGADTEFAQGILSTLPKVPASAYAADPNVVDVQEQQVDMTTGLLRTVVQSAAALPGTVEANMDSPEARSTAVRLLSSAVPGLTSSEANEYVAEVVKASLEAKRTGAPMKMPGTPVVTPGGGTTPLAEGTSSNAGLLFAVAARGPSKMTELFGQKMAPNFSDATTKNVNMVAGDLVTRTLRAVMPEYKTPEYKDSDVLRRGPSPQEEALVLGKLNGVIESDPGLKAVFKNNVDARKALAKNLAAALRESSTTMKASMTPAQIATTEITNEAIMERALRYSGGLSETSTSGGLGTPVRLAASSLEAILRVPSPELAKELKKATPTSSSSQVTAQPKDPQVGQKGAAKVKAFFDNKIDRATYENVRARTAELGKRMDGAIAGWGWETELEMNSEMRKPGAKPEDVAKIAIEKAKKAQIQKREISTGSS